jgi:hypothetical protein
MREVKFTFNVDNAFKAITHLIKFIMGVIGASTIKDYETTFNCVLKIYFYCLGDKNLINLDNLIIYYGDINNYRFCFLIILIDANKL